MAEKSGSRLGRGLASLIGDVGGETAQPERPRNNRKVPIEFLKPNPRNPRRTFSDAELGELADLGQAARCDPADRGAAGEGCRRIATRSSPANGAGAPRSLPACTKCRSFRSMSATADALEIMIIENVQREDLNAMEEAQGYHALADEFKRSQEDIAREVGKSRSHVANMMRLTKLPAEVQALYRQRQIVGRPRPRPDRRAGSGGRGEAHRRGGSERPPDRGAGA